MIYTLIKFHEITAKMKGQTANVTYCSMMTGDNTLLNNKTTFLCLSISNIFLNNITSFLCLSISNKSEEKHMTNQMEFMLVKNLCRRKLDITYVLELDLMLHVQ